MRARFALFAALAGTGALASPAAAQDSAPVLAPATPSTPSNPLCAFHGEGCEAPPAEWTWQRLAPGAGGYTVELPCDSKQADAFGQVIAMSRAKFAPGGTRACMKASSGFVVTIIGFAGSAPDGVPQSEIDALLNGSPDLFTAFLKQTRSSGVAESAFKGRRAVMNTIEKADRRTRVMLVEVGPVGVIMITADINSDFPGTREEADAAVERFIQSLEIAA